MSDLAHGWPDQEARPMPFGSVLGYGNAVALDGAGQLAVADLPAGAWRSLAVVIDSGGVALTLASSWQLLGGPTVAPVAASTHPGAGEVVLIPAHGHILTSLLITGPPGTPLSYAVLGSNINKGDTGSGSGTETPIPSTLVTVADPAMGADDVLIYTVPAGMQASVRAIAFRAHSDPGVAPNALLEVLTPAGDVIFNGDFGTFGAFSAGDPSEIWFSSVSNGGFGSNLGTGVMAAGNIFGVAAGTWFEAQSFPLLDSTVWLPAGFTLHIRVSDMAVPTAGQPVPLSQLSKIRLLVALMDA